MGCRRKERVKRLSEYDLLGSLMEALEQPNVTEQTKQVSDTSRAAAHTRGFVPELLFDVSQHNGGNKE
jgi:hypothetical protein